MIRTFALLCLVLTVIVFGVWQINKQNSTTIQVQAQATDALQTIPIPHITIALLANSVIENPIVESNVVESPIVENPVITPSVNSAEVLTEASSTNTSPSAIIASANTLVETNTAAPTVPVENSVVEAEATTCSSPDGAGLSSAFERELGSFLNNAAATYGSQYSNLHYSVSNHQITQDGEQGTVSANYQGSVTEIATGEAISASGGMTVNFAWDGCYWQMVDYSYF
jgi:hypothetical protein